MNVNTNRMVELALVFFVSLLSFSIGTFVGKKYSDNQHRLAQLEPHGEKAQELAKEVHAATEGSAEHGAQTAHNEPKIVSDQKAQETLTDHEVAQMAKEFSDDETVSDSKDVEETTAEAPVKTAKAMKKLAALKSKDIKVVEENAAGKDVVRDVASITAKIKKAANPDSFAYTVQVAAYPSADEAEKMVTTLGARGYKGRAVEADVNGRKWFRVQVGNFENFKEADTYKKEIMEQNRLTSALVQKVVRAPANVESSGHAAAPAAHNAPAAHIGHQPTSTTAPTTAPEHH